MAVSDKTEGFVKQHKFKYLKKIIRYFEQLRLRVQGDNSVISIPADTITLEPHPSCKMNDDDNSATLASTEYKSS